MNKNEYFITYMLNQIKEVTYNMTRELQLSSVEILNKYDFGPWIFNRLIKKGWDDNLSPAEFIRCIPTLDVLLRHIGNVSDYNQMTDCYNELSELLINTLRVMKYKKLHKDIIDISDIDIRITDQHLSQVISLKFNRNKQLKSLKVDDGSRMEKLTLKDMCW